MPVPKDTTKFREYMGSHLGDINKYLSSNGVEKALTYEEIDTGLRGLEDPSLLQQMLNKAKNFVTNLAETIIEKSELSIEEMETVKTMHNLRNFRNTLAQKEKENPKIKVKEIIKTLDALIEKRTTEKSGIYSPFSSEEHLALQNACG